MIYLIYGDYKKVLKKGKDLIENLLSKQPNAVVQRYNVDNVTFTNLDYLIEGQGLFFDKQIIVFSKVLENKETTEILSLKIKELSDSKNIFIFQEEKVLKTLIKKFEKNGAKVQFFEGKEQFEKEKINVFEIANTFLLRDKKNTWLLYQKYINEGISAEEIFGILWWQIKTLLLAEKCKNAKEAGIKDFPFNKAKGALKNFKKGELEKIAGDLIQIYHDARLQGVDLALKLEEFVLKN